MRRARVAGALSLLAVFFLSGCSDSAVDDDSSATGEALSQPPISEERPVADAPPAWSLSASPEDAQVCKIPDGRPAQLQTLREGSLSLGTYGMSNVGFPVSPDLIALTGESHYLVVAVSFPDLPGDPQNLDAYLQEQTQLMTQWSEFWSQGTHRYTFDVVPGWVEVASRSNDFRVDDQSRGERTSTVHRALASEVAMAIGPGVEWDNVDGLLAVFPPTFDAFPHDWNGRGDLVETPIGERALFYYGGGPFHMTSDNGIPVETKRSLLWSFWVHEILHSQSMNLHAPGNGWPVGLDRNQYPAGGGKFSAAANSWELFKLGWIKDSQVQCVDARGPISQTTVILTPLEIQGGDRRIALVRTGEYSGVLVESRRPIGYTQWAPEDSGIMVYTVDTTVMNDRSGEGGEDCGNNPDFVKWAYYVAPDGTADVTNPCSFEDFVVTEGESVTVGSVTVELVHSGDSLDYVRIY